MTPKVRPATRFHVRAATSADEASWRKLWKSYCVFYAVSIPDEVTDALWVRIMDRSASTHALVAETFPINRGRPEAIGFAHYILHPYTWGTELICYLEDLFIAEHARGNGAGRALIQALTGMAKENGWPRVYWHTHELNEPARALYEKITPRDPFVRYVVKVK